MAKKVEGEILVTGSGGALAQQVIQKLKRHYKIVAVDFRRRAYVEEGIASYRVEYQKRGFEDIFRNHNICGVIHLGRMGLHELDHRHRYNANVWGTQRLLDLCLQYGVQQVVVLSTYFVYGASPYNPKLLTEDDPLKASELTMDLVDSVELENLASLYLWKHSELNITILRPCNIIGPGVFNSMSLLFSGKVAPVIMGYSPEMQFIHVEDAARAIKLAYEKNISGIYNVAPKTIVSYQTALRRCGCLRVPIPAFNSNLPNRIAAFLNMRKWPVYLVSYYKYPVIIDGSLFNKTFGFRTRHNIDDALNHYREKKELGIL